MQNKNRKVSGRYYSKYLILLVVFFALAEVFYFSYSKSVNFKKYENGTIEKTTEQVDAVEKKESNVPKVAVISGEIVAVSRDVVTIKADVGQRRDVVIRVRVGSQVQKVDGSYDKNGNFVLNKKYAMNSFEIDEGDRITLSLESPAVIGELDDSVLVAERVTVSPPLPEGMEKN